MCIKYANCLHVNTKSYETLFSLNCSGAPFKCTEPFSTLAVILTKEHNKKILFTSAELSTKPQNSPTLQMTKTQNIQTLLSIRFSESFPRDKDASRLLKNELGNCSLTDGNQRFGCLGIKCCDQFPFYCNFVSVGSFLSSKLLPTFQVSDGMAENFKSKLTIIASSSSSLFYGLLRKHVQPLR